MLWWLVIVATGVVAAKMADIEDRNPAVFGVPAAVATWFLSRSLGSWFGLAPLVALAAVFAVLWILRSRDDRNHPGGRVVR